MCLASANCRSQDVSFPLSTGKTSAATKHLKKAHDVTSERTEVSNDRRRTRESDLDRVRNSQMFRDDPGCVYVLMETLRIVNNNLPFRLGEYEESITIRELVYKDSVQAAMNAKVVSHSIVELYALTKGVLEDLLRSNRIGSAPTFTAVADFWSSKVQATKYLGLRLYLVTEQFELKSVLLGTQHFVPRYGEREGGIRRPFRCWLSDILRDFGLSPCDLYGSTTDAGPDVRWMMTEGLKLNWQWCIPHLTNAATKAACGMVTSVDQSKNPAITALIRRIVKTIYTVKHVEVMGSLFEELCLYGKGGKSPHQLLEYRAHRFLGLTRVIKRILDLWEPLVTWYAERLDRARRSNADLPAEFPLERDYQHLTQLLSLLQPITLVNIKSQGESANQVDVLLTLYKLRITVLDCSKELRDYRSTNTHRIAFRPEDLTPLAASTRSLLYSSFHARFFSRYTDRKEIAKCSFVLEMQLFLHPNFKNFDGFLRKIITLCNADSNGVPTAARERNFAKIKKTISDKVRSLMNTVAMPRESSLPVAVDEPLPAPPTLFSEDMMECFGDIIHEERVAPEAVNDMNAARVDEELERWEGAAMSIQMNDNRPENVLEFGNAKLITGRSSSCHWWLEFYLPFRPLSHRLSEISAPLAVSNTATRLNCAAQCRHVGIFKLQSTICRCHTMPQASHPRY